MIDHCNYSSVLHFESRTCACGLSVPRTSPDSDMIHTVVLVFLYYCVDCQLWNRIMILGWVAHALGFVYIRRIINCGVFYIIVLFDVDSGVVSWLIISKYDYHPYLALGRLNCSWLIVRNVITITDWAGLEIDSVVGCPWRNMIRIHWVEVDLIAADYSYEISVVIILNQVEIVGSSWFPIKK